MYDKQQNETINRETEMVYLWIFNDPVMQYRWSTAAAKLYGKGNPAAETAELGSSLRQVILKDAPKMRHGMYAALLHSALARVDWLQIAELMLTGVGRARSQSGSVPAED